MARIRIDLPERFAFTTEIVVRVTDLNYGAHLGNDSMLSLIHEARARFFHSLGVSERDVDGTALVLADAAIAYRAEAFAGDPLRFEVAATDPSRVGCDLVYRVSRRGELVAEAKTGLVFLDPESRRPTALPQRMRDLVADGAPDSGRC